MTRTLRAKTVKRDGDDGEWAPVQQTVRKRRTKKETDRRKTKEHIIKFLDWINDDFDIIYGGMLKGEYDRSNWIRRIESLKWEIRLFQSDVREYGLRQEEEE